MLSPIRIRTTLPTVGTVPAKVVPLLSRALRWGSPDAF
jgi:hypothetical protein